MSILFNKKRIRIIIILIMAIMICFSVNTKIIFAAWYEVINPLDKRSVWSIQGMYNFINPTTPLFLPEDDGLTDKERTLQIEKRALQKQRDKQSARRKARSEFTPLNPIKGVTDAGAARDPSKFFNGMFIYGISIAAFLAVLMIAIGGIQYMSTDAVSGKTEGKERIQYAVMGLLLVLFSWILLRQINPSILNFDFLDNNSSNSSFSSESRVNTTNRSGTSGDFIEFSVNIPTSADDKIRELEGFIKSGHLSENEIKAAQKIINTLKNQ